MTTPRCEMCPFRRDCHDCPWSGENPTATTVSDARTGVATGKIGSVPRTRETAPDQCANTAEGLTHSDITGRADHMVANPHPYRTHSVRGGADA